MNRYYSQYSSDWSHITQQPVEKAREEYSPASETIESFEPAVLAEFYKYQRIEEPWTTRVLVLSPGNETDRLEGHLETLEIGSGQEYRALSYVWGEPHETDVIFIDGKRLSITKSLDAALRHGRFSDKPLRIWVDQLCINQKDNIERSQQVQLMHAIFKHATQVLVWLGLDPDGLASRAFQLCKSLCSIFDDELLAVLCMKAGAEFDWIPNKHWDALRELTELPWFRRAWIPQEIGTDTPAIVQWGHAHIKWEPLVQAMRKLAQNWELRKKHNIHTRLVTSLYRGFVEQPDVAGVPAQQNFVYQLYLSALTVASDPRDYVFSRLGHYSAWIASERKMIIQPDYDNSIEAIYHEIAIRSLKAYSNLTILNAVINDAKTQLPSWVPRWDTEQRLCNLIGYPGRYKAFVAQNLEISFEDDFKTLVLKGYAIDTIARTTAKFVPECFSPHSKKRSILRSARSLTGLQSKEPFRSKPRYRNAANISALEAFLDTLAPSAVVAAIDPEASLLGSGIAALDRMSISNPNPPSKHDPRKKKGSSSDNPKAKPSVWMQVAENHAAHRKFAVTEEGYFAMVPSIAEQGDILCALFGGETPYVLRKIHNHRYSFIGEAYEHSFANNRASFGTGYAEEVFRIQ